MFPFDRQSRYPIKEATKHTLWHSYLRNLGTKRKKIIIEVVCFIIIT